MSHSGTGYEKRHRVAVIGAGYVGLPTAATLAHFGHHVVLAERDPSRLSALRSGRMPIVEAGLDELVAEAVAAGNLSFIDSAMAENGILVSNLNRFYGSVAVSDADVALFNERIEPVFETVTSRFKRNAAE